MEDTLPTLSSEGPLMARTRVEANGASRFLPGITTGSLLLGVPLAATFLFLVDLGHIDHPLVQRYLTHWVERWEVVLFACGLAALFLKACQLVVEWRASRCSPLPAWDGEPIPVDQAESLLANLDAEPANLRSTWLGQRVRGVLEFVVRRRSADQLDDQMRTLADNDALALESSYALVRFICWAIPILGFLGTVLGITDAIAGVTPERLEENLNAVTDGLALAFDTTALGLLFTMILMFLSYVVERAEQGFLTKVDRYVADELAHRFERSGFDAGDVAGLVRTQTQALLKQTERVVERQAEIWAKVLAETETRRLEAERSMQDRIAASLDTALCRSLDAHARRLVEGEQKALELQSQLVERLVGLAGTLRDVGRQQEASAAKLADTLSQRLDAALSASLDAHARQLGDADRKAIEQQQRLAEQLAAMAEAVRETGQQQQIALARVADRLGHQAETLARLQDDERQLIGLQETLHRNLESLAGAGAFEEAVNSLTAAIHLLTARAAPAPTSRRGPGAAA